MVLRGFAFVGLIAASLLVSVFSIRPTRTAAQVAPPNICIAGQPNCGHPTPVPTPKPTPTRDPVHKTPPGVPGDDFNYHNVYQYFPVSYYLDAYADISTTAGLTADPSDVDAFTTTEEWRQDGSDLEAWQEIGYAVGYFTANYYVGVFAAFQEPFLGYFEIEMGGFPQPALV